MRGAAAAPRWSEGTTLAVGAVAALAAFGAGVAGCAPTGLHGTDVTLTALLAAVLVGLGARARPLPLAVAAAVALVAGGDLALRGVALAALLGAGALAWAGRARRGPGAADVADGAARSAPVWAPLLGAAVAGAAVQVLLRIPLEEPVRLSAVVAAAGMVPVAVSGWRGLTAAGHRWARRGLLVGLVATLVVAAAGGAAVLLSASALRDGVDRTEAGLDAVREGETAQAGADLRAAGDRFGAAEDASGAWWAEPARHLPLVAPQLAAVDAMAEGGAETAALAADGADQIDDEDLQLVDGRIDPEAVAAVAPVLEDVAARTAALRARLDGALPAEVWQAAPVADGVDRFRTRLAEAEGSARTGALAAELGPELLGADGEARYLVAFVTPAEARGTGFLGSYGVLTADDGEVELTTVGRNKDLDAAGDDDREISGPPDYLERYSRFEPESTWENVTFTPDGPTAARVMAELYPQSGGEEVDGVLRIDPAGIARLLRVTGPVEVEGLPYPLDATNVEQFLLVEQYRLYPDRDERVDVLGDVAAAVFDALTEQEVAPAALARALGPAVRGGDVTLWLRSEEGERLVERLGLSGAVPPVVDDGFGVVTQNAAGNKVDTYLQRTIRYEAEVDAASGRVRATAEIGLVNTAPTSGEPPYIIGNLVDAPEGTNRMYLSAYSPLDLVAAEVDGDPVTLEEGVELGRNVWSAFLDVPAGGTANVTLELEGEADLSDGRYRFDWLPQVMARPDRVSVAVTATGGRLEDPETDARGPDGAALEATTGEDGAARVEVPAVRGPFWLEAEVRREAPASG